MEACLPGVSVKPAARWAEYCLPVAPLIIRELNTDSSWGGVYIGLMAIAALIGQLQSSGFIIRNAAIPMSQIAALDWWRGGGRNHQRRGGF